MKNKKILGLMLAGMMLANVVPQVSLASNDYNVKRIDGVHRYHTAMNIAESAFTKCDRAVLVSGDNFADALTAGNLANHAPIFLAEKEGISQGTVNTMYVLGVKEVVIIGGEKAVPKSVEERLKKENLKVIRIAGRNRYETSTKLAKQLKAKNKDNVVLANGEKFADALSAAPYAVQKKQTLVLTDGKTLPKDVKAKDVKTIIGGEKSVNIKGLNKVQRISGKDRYETSLEVLKHMDKTQSAVIADGKDYPDALAAAPYAVKKNTGILLSDDTAIDKIKEYVDSQNISDITLIGGEKSITKYQEQKFTKTSTEQKPQEKPEDKPENKPEDKKPEEKPEVNIDNLVNFDNFDTREDAERAAKVALTKDEFKEFNSFVVKQGHDGKWYVRFKFIEETKPQDQALWRQERLKPQSSKDIDLSNFDIDTPLSEKEKELVKLINDYRISLGKKPLNVSKSLTYVARTHTKDQVLHFENNLKDERGLPANLHSWSKYGNWTPVMYTADHKYHELSDKKPKELTKYTFGGTEISAGQQYYDQVHQMTPSMALDLWKNSPGHNHEIIKNNIFYNAFHAERIMGISIHDGFANVWFGSDPTDPAEFHITYEK
ncbi:cell wall-binding repeat-containing protein [Finegoldia magna]|uniref:cell wall-binding repeat-containing protein n=1 Tax=Finegoldia magna TaxID=1260 RepID=UPI002911AAB2|nr:cell wall-binding repeat-containing protein [Finegoldia magna]MDU5200913.1 cell wall-binding repeat-containing protein [Finegoldia magna]MDU6775694.1 cell wall-binding repeat-containing protein [Finegoldia magna]